MPRASPDIDNVKVNVKQQLAVSLDNYFQNTSGQIIASIGDYITQLQEQMKSEMDGYLLKYREEVNRQITAEQTAIAIIQENINNLQQNIYEINDRRRKNQHDCKTALLDSGRKYSLIQVLSRICKELESEDVKNIEESEILISKLKQLSCQMREFDSHISELS